ncbi:hypothetical protein FRX31_009591 [Thalictrum thalictroides]|uniref:Uncharacterized protein n=1 Tax=Thalictrum thalictroides TaxID=46969 RepID=A0A7J6WXI9_THATH|nr:hypothetical protein FRX31_009591 [Thalictrum thalictroides]
MKQVAGRLAIQDSLVTIGNFQFIFFFLVRSLNALSDLKVTDPSCEQVITQAYAQQTSGSISYSFCQKLAYCRRVLIQWNDHHFGNPKVRRIQIQQELQLYGTHGEELVNRKDIGDRLQGYFSKLFTAEERPQSSQSLTLLDHLHIPK